MINYLLAIATFCLVTGTIVGFVWLAIIFPLYFFGAAFGLFIATMVQTLKLMYDDIYGRR